MELLLLATRFSPRTSAYQRMKIELLSILEVSKDAVHIYVGVGCLLVTLLLMRKVRWKALLPGLLVSLAMETIDLRDNWRDDERVHWKASLHDVVNTNALPVVLVLFLRRKWIRL